MIKTHENHRLKKLKVHFDSIKKGRDMDLEKWWCHSQSERAYQLIRLQGYSISRSNVLKGNLIKDRGDELWTINGVLSALSQTISEPKSLSAQWMCELHQMIVHPKKIQDGGRFREDNEWIVTAAGLTPGPSNVKSSIDHMFNQYRDDYDGHIFDKIARMLLTVKRLSPFLLVNGWVEYFLLNAYMMQSGFPPVIIHLSDKPRIKKAIQHFNHDGTVRELSRVLLHASMEAMHYSLAWIEGKKTVSLSEYAKHSNLSLHALINQARRQTIPAFREKGVWMIANEGLIER